MTIKEQAVPKEIIVASIMTLVVGSLLLVIFFYMMFWSNVQFSFIFSIFFGAIINILSIIDLIISIPLFGCSYGLVRKEEWSRRITINLSFIGIIIALVHIVFYVFILNDADNIIMGPLLIVIGCSIVSICFLYRSNVVTYFSNLALFENEIEKEMSRSLSILSSDTVTLYLKIFLIAEILFVLIAAFQSLIDFSNPELIADEIDTVMEIFDYIIFAGVTIFLIWWFSRTYSNLKGLGISGLNFSKRRIILSFIIPVLNFYEPVRLIRTLWKASEPSIHITGLSWKDVSAPTGLFGVWWFFVLASWVMEVEFFGGLESIKGILIDPIFVPIANISTILLVVRINSRVDKTRELMGEILYWDPVEKVRLHSPADWDRHVKNGIITLYPSKEKNIHEYSQDLQMSIEDEPTTNIDMYVKNTISHYKNLFTDFSIIRVNTNLILAGHKSYQMEYQYRLSNWIIKNLEAGTIVNHKSYRIEYEAVAEKFLVYLDTARKIINSLELRTHL
jgi:hypothetical protein